MAFRLVCGVVVLLVAVECMVITGKAFYCRDPDTGKLHAVNSTWESQSFCGNYTCKIRRRNTTNSHFVLRQINITNVPLPDKIVNKINFISKNERSEENNEDYNDNSRNKVVPGRVDTEEPQNLGKEPVVGKTYLRTDNNYYTNDNFVHIPEKTKTEHSSQTDDVQRPMQHNNHENTLNDLKALSRNKDDRYLTEREIEAISHILHSVKRSELNAIVDIYNLAQEIYSEMEKSTVNPDIDTPSSSTNEKMAKIGKYWYDPDYKGINIADPGPREIKNAHSTIKPKKSFYSFFTGPALYDNDVRRRPYDYSNPNTQNSASYFVEQPTTKAEPKLCKKKLEAKVPISNLQSNGHPSYLLPYPFTYMNQYHLPTDYPKGLLYNLPYTWDYNKAKKVFANNDFIDDISGRKADLLSPRVQDSYIKHDELLMEPIGRTHKGRLDRMPTDENLLGKLIKTLDTDLEGQRNENRGKVNTTRIVKTFPTLRKKISVDIGKTLKADTLVRKRREEQTPDPISEEEGTFETYLERTTCIDIMEPGFFRMGNLTQPYPSCCPQLIKNR